MSGVGLLILGAAVMVGAAAFQTGTSFVFLASGLAWGSLLVAFFWGRWQARGAWSLAWGGDLLGEAHQAGQGPLLLWGPPGRSGYLLCPLREGHRPPSLFWWSLPGPDWAVVPFHLGPDGSVALQVPWPAGPRGISPAPELWRLDSDPWGLMPRAKALKPLTPAWLRRHPPAVAPSHLPWLDQLAGTALGQAARGAPGPGAGLRGVRPHAPGDPLRAVHWRTTARKGGAWHVRDAEREASPFLQVALDGFKGAHDPASFEAMASGAAALMAYAQVRGWPLQLSAEGDRPSDLSMAQALAWLAELKPNPQPTPVPSGPGHVVVGPRPPAEAAAWVATPSQQMPSHLGAVAVLAPGQASAVALLGVAHG